MSTVTQERLKKAKQLVVEYITKHELTENLNASVNDLCRNRPSDPWLFLADALADMQSEAPRFDRITARNAIDNSGQCSIQLNLHGRVSSTRPPKYVCSSYVGLRRSEGNTENKDQISEQQTSNIMETNNKIIDKITQIISPALRKYQIHEQSKIDQTIVKLYHEHFLDDPMISQRYMLINAISSMISIGAAMYLRKPLYTYFYQDITSSNTPTSPIGEEPLMPPNIMIRLVQAPGLPSIFLIPSHRLEPIKRITVLRTIRNALQSMLEEEVKKKKASSDNVGDVNIVDEKKGNLIAFHVNTIEELLALVHKCVVDVCQYRISNNTGDVSLYLSYRDSHAFEYNEEEHSYNIHVDRQAAQTTKKNAEEMVKYYTDLIAKHPEEISYLEDPIHKQDSDCWIDLTQTLRTQSINTNKENDTGNTTSVSSPTATNHIKVIGNQVYESVAEHVQPAIANKWSNGMVISIQDMTTVSQALRIARTVNQSEESHNFELIVDDGFLDSSCSSYAIDLAVACRAKLIVIPPIACGQGIEKYNRWLSVCEELSARNVSSFSTDPTNKSGKVNGNKENEKEELP